MYLISKLITNGHRKSYSKGLAALMTNYFIAQFAVAMVSVFGAVFIYQLGSSFTQGMSYILLFFGLQRFLTLFTIPLIGFLTAKIGYRWMMTTGLLFLAGKLLILSLTTSATYYLLIPTAILGSISIPAYYLSFHALFIDDNEDGHIGEQMGALLMLARLAAVVSPFFAGLLIDSFNFTVMFIVAMTILLISTIPLFLMPQHSRHPGFNLEQVFKTILRNKTFTFSTITWQLESAVQVYFWPVFLLLVVKSYTVFGIIGSLVMLLGSLSVFFAGKLFDKKHNKAVFLLATLATMISWVLRFLSKTTFFIAASDSMKRSLSPYWWMKLRRHSLVVGEKTDSLVFGAAWEYLVTIGLVIGIFIGYAVLILSKGTWLWLLAPALIGIVLTVIPFIKDEKN